MSLKFGKSKELRTLIPVPCKIYYQGNVGHSSLEAAITDHCSTEKLLLGCALREYSLSI